MSEEIKSRNFIEQIIEEDLEKGFPKDKLRFRFPPEPNGYLHIGHAKAICLNFGLGEKYQAPVNLRFDDTNPVKEEQEYVDAIRKDIEWLGYQWDKECYASDYFQQLYNWAIQMIQDGKAYVDDQSSEIINQQRGIPSKPGIESPYRNRSVKENLDLFEKMQNGDVEESSKVLRAKIDMNSSNMFMRDPVMYRILKENHHRTGSKWNIYPMYDWAHGESDYIEQISHSLCSLEFKHHRPLYDWYLDQVYDISKVRNKQREFARGNVEYMITSKRKLTKLIEEKIVSGWDDPRMPTISGLRRRGYTPESIKIFWEKVGIAKRDNVIDISLLEYAIRDHLNQTAPRVMAVLDPLKIVITNYSEEQEEILIAENSPNEEDHSTREVPFSRELYIEKEDFKEEAGRKFFRLALGKEVRLKNAYIIKAERCDKDENGNVTTVYCTYDSESKSGSGTEASKRKVKGTLHWVSIKHTEKAEVRIYDRLFSDPAPDTHKDENGKPIDFMNFLNQNSIKTITGYAEPYLKNADVGNQFQFQRLGYFVVDPDSTNTKKVFNRTVTLKDTWVKMNDNNTVR
ncbi:MAG: glutamine--tRNA ligase/YqeY domain fusion protein [Flavobacteriales bacterium]